MRPMSSAWLRVTSQNPTVSPHKNKNRTLAQSRTCYHCSCQDEIKQDLNLIQRGLCTAQRYQSPLQTNW
ncbi:hypothetical protein N7495_008974 [Penicillium taxi]|uniref:uncharacterized protein n=1 Tax=Penicillium taxi TaxID=168475 RepID=UPI002545761E|nr:uncharacterized protein N7495_008974 [Penicillium taxi]KAJ5888933.1 hypothetical protein N7495_008974 [Penicillium taxi]